MVDGEKLSDGANVVGGGLNKMTGLVNNFIQGVTDFFGSLSWIEWAILIIVIIAGIVYWVLKKQYESYDREYNKKRIKKFKF